MSKWVKNGAVIALVALVILVALPFAANQYGISLTPGAPRDSGVTQEQIEKAVNNGVNNGIKPLASQVAGISADIAKTNADITATNNRLGGLETRFNAWIKKGANGAAATPAPPNLNQVDCNVPGEPGSTYTVGWMYRDAIGCPWFIVLDVDDNTGDVLRYDWLPDSCVPIDSKDMGHEPDNYPDCANVPTPTPAATPVNPPTGLAQCPSPEEVNMLFANGADAFVPEGSPPYEYCLFETKANGYWRDHPLPCNPDWALEMDTMGPEGRYWFCNVDDEGRSFWIDHASIRLVPAYAPGDPLYNPCSALENSRRWLRSKGEPARSWAPELRPGNFDCPGEPAAGEPLSYEGIDPNSPWGEQPGTQPDNHGGETQKVCPPSDKPGRVANLVGGKAEEWTFYQREGGYWKRISSTGDDLKNPWGSLDVWTGKVTLHPKVGRKAFGFEATWHCNA